MNNTSVQTPNYNQFISHCWDTNSQDPKRLFPQAQSATPGFGCQQQPFSFITPLGNNSAPQQVGSSASMANTDFATAFLNAFFSTDFMKRLMSNNIGSYDDKAAEESPTIGVLKADGESASKFCNGPSENFSSTPLSKSNSTAHNQCRPHKYRTEPFSHKSSDEECK